MSSHYKGPITDHFDGKRFYVKNHAPDKTFKDLLRWSFGEKRASWPKHYPSPFQDKPPQRIAKNKARITLIGHASYLLQSDGLNILIDPVYSERVSPVSFAGPKRVNSPGIVFDDLPPIDHVLITHSHYDHLDLKTLSRLQQKFGPQFLCPLGNDIVMRNTLGWGAKIIARDWGETVRLGNITTHLEPTYHWSARTAFDRRRQLWCGFLLETAVGNIYHIGDTGYADGTFFRDIKKKHGAIRLATIPIGAYEPRWFMADQHVNPTEAVQILRDCGATQAIGHHWGTFQLTNEAIDDPFNHLNNALDAANVHRELFSAFRPGQFLEITK